jgi:hypothetical protein
MSKALTPRPEAGKRHGKASKLSSHLLYLDGWKFAIDRHHLTNPELTLQPDARDHLLIKRCDTYPV